MSDYIAGRLAHERQADYLRKAEHDKLVAQVHRVDRPSRGAVLNRLTNGGARRHLITAVGAIALALAVAAPVAADNASYPGCSYFGAVATGDYAPHGALGALVNQYAPTGPGVLSGIVQEEHDLFCAPH